MNGAERTLCPVHLTRVLSMSEKSPEDFQPDVLGPTVILFLVSLVILLVALNYLFPGLAV